MDGHTNEPRWQFSLAALLMLIAATAAFMSAFMATGGLWRFNTVICFLSFLGYIAGRSFRQDHVNSGYLGFACAFVVGTFYGVYIYPVLENDYHDLSSIGGVVGWAWISGAVASLLIAVAGSALHPPCPHCGEPLRSPTARNCRVCKMDRRAPVHRRE